MGEKSNNIIIELIKSAMRENGIHLFKVHEGTHGYSVIRWYGGKRSGRIAINGTIVAASKERIDLANPKSDLEIFVKNEFVKSYNGR